jgi:hypothetical protein
VQRAGEEAVETPAALPGPEPTSAVGVASSSGSAAVPSKPGGQDLDELARRLYVPVSAMLRAELLLDRERVGRSLVR